MPFFNLNPNALQTLNQHMSALVQYRMRNKMFEQSLQGQVMAEQLEDLQRTQERKQLFDMGMQSLEPGDVKGMMDLALQYGSPGVQQQAAYSMIQMRRDEMNALSKMHIAEQELAADAGRAAAQGANERAYSREMQELWQQDIPQEQKEFKADVIRSKYDPANPIDIPRATKEPQGRVPTDPTIETNRRMGILEDQLDLHYEDYEVENDIGEMETRRRIIKGHEKIVANIKKEMMGLGKAVGYDFGEPEKVTPPPPKFLEDTSVPTTSLTGGPLQGPPTPSTLGDKPLIQQDDDNTEATAWLKDRGIPITETNIKTYLAKYKR